MMLGICDYFSVSPGDLVVLFEKAGREAHKNTYLDGDILNKIIEGFIDSNMPSTIIDQILFFHLSRRLNSIKDNYPGKNLFDLLTSDNETTRFLKNHEIEFLPVDDYIDLIYKGEIIPLTDSFQDHVPYLRWRLGHHENRIDYCFNGFMLKDLLYKNHYARDLSQVPEFISVLLSFLKRRDLIEEYYKNSTYYCFEYCVPLSKVFFDSDEKLSNEEKQRYLLSQVLKRLYDYHFSEQRCMFDHDNPIIRLHDTDTMDEKYYVSIEKITEEMLRY